MIPTPICDMCLKQFLDRPKHIITNHNVNSIFIVVCTKCRDIYMKVEEESTNKQLNSLYNQYKAPKE